MTLFIVDLFSSNFLNIWDYAVEFAVKYVCDIHWLVQKSSSIANALK